MLLKDSRSDKGDNKTQDFDGMLLFCFSSCEVSSLVSLKRGFSTSSRMASASRALCQLLSAGIENFPKAEARLYLIEKSSAKSWKEFLVSTCFRSTYSRSALVGFVCFWFLPRSSDHEPLILTQVLASELTAPWISGSLWFDKSFFVFFVSKRLEEHRNNPKQPYKKL